MRVFFFMNFDVFQVGASMSQEKVGDVRTTLAFLITQTKNISIGTVRVKLLKKIRNFDVVFLS